MATNVKSDLYKNAGVDIDLATSLLSQVKAKLASARRPEMLSPIGGFGGLFQIDHRQKDWEEIYPSVNNRRILSNRADGLPYP